MIKFGERCPDVQISFFQQSQAKVHIAKSQHIIRVKTTGGEKYFFAHHQAGGSVGGSIANLLKQSIVTRSVTVVPLVSMPCHPAYAHRDARMLNGLVWVE